jgi:hypothetical protein
MMMMREQQQQQQKQQHRNNSVMKKNMIRCLLLSFFFTKRSLSDTSQSSADEVNSFLSSLTFDPCTASCLHWICPFIPQKSIKKDEKRKSWKTNTKMGTAR